jgi:hypothetical protein
LTNEIHAVLRTTLTTHETLLAVGRAHRRLLTGEIHAVLGTTVAVHEALLAIGRAHRDLSADAIVTRLRTAFGTRCAWAVVRGAHRCRLAGKIDTIAGTAIKVGTATCAIALAAKGTTDAAVALLLATFRRRGAFVAIRFARRCATNTVAALL